MQLPPTVLSTDRRRDKTKKPTQQGKKQAVALSSKSTKPTSKVADSPEQPGPAIEEHDSDSQPTDADSEVDAVEEVAEQVLDTSLSDNNRTRKIRDPILRPPKTLETTLFDRLEKMYGSSIKRMLEIQYR
jgi:DNA polymerase alpha-associated DNA helicase A